VLVLRGEPQGRPQDARASSKYSASPLTRWTVGSEKELGFGRGQALMGKACGQEASQRRVYKHALERIGVRIALRAVKRAGLRFDPV